jgi:hypothetical protein
MGAEVANTTCSVLRGVTITSYGDLQDDRNAYLTGVPVSLIENAEIVNDPATQTPMIIRSSVCLLPEWTGVLDSDQILDETTGDIYSVQDIIRPPTTMGAPVDIKLILRRISSKGG